jgi:hypothetical protein
MIRSFRVPENVRHTKARSVNLPAQTAKEVSRMAQRRSEPMSKHQELREKRLELHGHRRKLHDRLTEVCEDFVLENLSRKYKQSTLVRELEYILDYYRDEENWQGIE